MKQIGKKKSGIFFLKENWMIAFIQYHSSFLSQLVIMHFLLSFFVNRFDVLTRLQIPKKEIKKKKTCFLQAF